MQLRGHKLLAALLTVALLWPGLAPLAQAAAPSLDIQICTGSGLETLRINTSESTKDKQQTLSDLCPYCVHRAGSHAAILALPAVNVSASISVDQTTTQNSLPYLRRSATRHARAPPVFV